MEKQIKMAAKLYEMRDTAKRFFGPEYLDKLKPYSDLLKKVMEANKEDELKAAMRLVQIESFADNGMAQLMVFAAAVELVEPSGAGPAFA